MEQVRLTTLKLIRKGTDPLTRWGLVTSHGLVQDCSNSSVLAVELLQSCTKPSIYDIAS